MFIPFGKMDTRFIYFLLIFNPSGIDITFRPRAGRAFTFFLQSKKVNKEDRR